MQVCLFLSIDVKFFLPASECEHCVLQEEDLSLQEIKMNSSDISH
jgi:hypothetical protein